MSAERPILFTGPMVRAILAGDKTQTRRVVKLPHANPLGAWVPDGVGGDGIYDSKGRKQPYTKALWHTRTGDIVACPYGVPGDRLWVRETWAAPHRFDAHPPREIPMLASIHYAASEEHGGLLWRSPIHMPRWASRITLEITGVRVERVQDISHADAIAEGVAHVGTVELREARMTIPQHVFACMWNEINGAWLANPWVWVIEFRTVPNV